jgi:hypothetical protein
VLYLSLGYDDDGKHVLPDCRASGASMKEGFVLTTSEVSVEARREVDVWSYQQGRMVDCLQGHPGDVSVCGFNGPLMVTASRAAPALFDSRQESTVFAWDVATGRILARFKPPQYLTFKASFVNLVGAHACTDGVDRVVAADGETVIIWKYINPLSIEKGIAATKIQTKAREKQRMAFTREARKVNIPARLSADDFLLCLRNV